MFSVVENLDHRGHRENPDLGLPLIAKINVSAAGEPALKTSPPEPSSGYPAAVLLLTRTN